MKATAEHVLGLQPQAVIVATGSYYSQEGRSAFRDLAIPGHDQPFVYRPEDILLDGARPSGRVVLLDGEGLHTSAGIAELLAASGAEVDYVTPGFLPLSVSLINSLEFDQVIARLKDLGVRFSPTSYLKSIEEHAVTLFDVHTGQERTVTEVDAVILVTARLPADTLARELQGRVERLYTVGDALAVRSWASAVYEGHKFAREVGEPAAFSTVGDAYFSTTNVDAHFLRPAEVLLPMKASPWKGNPG
jgi:dimethylamine/trimethylamine dehydrogenase